MLSKLDLGPRYREAYPALRIADAIRHAPRSDVTWLDQNDKIVGHGHLFRKEVKTFILTYQMQATPYMDDGCGSHVLHLRYGGKRSFGSPEQVLCTTCGKWVASLIFYNIDWACAKCHGILHNRTGVLSSVQRKSEELRDLRLTIGEGRPPGMRQTDYNAANARMNLLQHELAGKRAYASERNSQWIRAEWTGGAGAEE